MSEASVDYVRLNESSGDGSLSSGEESVSPWAWQDPVSRQLYQGTRLTETRARLQEERRKLPIWARREELVDLLRSNQVLVVKGETGSGKSTQLPQFFLGEIWRVGSDT